MDRGFFRNLNSKKSFEAVVSFQVLIIPIHLLSRAAMFTAAATLLVGIGYIAILPPFEGFDEYAHYSSIRQIADTGTLPLYGKSFIDKSVEHYLETAPTPWGNQLPPFEHAGRMTYSAFFKKAEAITYYQSYWHRPADWVFAPGTLLNWESQHPPLYYGLMAPVMKATERFSLVTQVFALRTASYLLAFLGFMIGMRATAAEILPDSVADGYALYPFVVPMFFGEFARIGNDSLCLLLFALICALSFRTIRDARDRNSAFAVGICFGLGLLTKAFFIPTLVGYTVFMGLRAWRAFDDREQLRRHITGLALVLLPAAVLGGGWYVYNYVVYGSFTGSVDTITVDQMGGLTANLLEKFSLYAFAHEIIAMLVTWSWAGSWSLARLSLVLYLPLLLLTGWIIAAYAREARHHSLSDSIWLPAWLLVPFLLGLVYHALVSIALGGTGTPGWYLHTLAPFLALAGGYGIAGIKRNAVGRVILGSALVYAAVFLIVAIWSQAALFSGCAIKDDSKYYQFSGDWFCLDQIASVADHLSVFGWPHVALLGIGAGFLCLAVALRSFFRMEYA